jgi:hypothetical protein
VEVELWQRLIKQLQERGVTFVAGLSDAEILAIEARFGFRFPPDLRAFLQTELPQGERFPDWRSGNEADLREWLDLPRQGVLFDIEHNGFWLEEWGTRPSTLEEACQIAEGLIAAAPPLIPIYCHRMMPAEPHLSGNPVFSVHQTDIIIYRVDLKDYLIHEFPTAEEDLDDRPPSVDARPIAFWDINRFQEVRWARGSCLFDNRRGQLPG